MTLNKEIAVENYYSGSNWDFEKTTKYVFDLEDKKCEAGYFEHYKDSHLLKTVIELPVSYGCLSKCQFCASSSIQSFKVLTENDLNNMFQYIYKEKELRQQKYVLLTMTGTGDLAFNFDNVFKFLLQLKDYSNIHITLSSCVWNCDMLAAAERLSQKLNIRNIQITYVSDIQKILQNTILIYKDRKSNFQEIIHFIEHSKNSYYRINYVMIKGINDTEDDFARFEKNVSKVKDKLIVRISKLNETNATIRNGLIPTEIKDLRKLHIFLNQADIPNYIFYAMKNDHMNCGQLITESHISVENP